MSDPAVRIVVTLVIGFAVGLLFDDLTGGAADHFRFVSVGW